MKKMLFFVAFLALSLPSFARAAPLIVTTIADSGSGSLRAAILSANSQTSPATVTFSPGLSGVIPLQSAEPDITASVTIQGPGASLLAVDGAGKFRPFHITAGQTTLSGLTVQHGYFDTTTSSRQYPAVGGGIAIDYGAALILTSCTFSANNSNQGGAIYNIGTVTATDCTFSANKAIIPFGTLQLGNGGAFWSAYTCSLVMTRCTLTGNSASESGGAIQNGGDLTLTDCTLTGNRTLGGAPGTSSNGFGGCIDGSDHITMIGCLVVGNVAYSAGGALAAGNNSTIVGCTFAANSAGDGGAIFDGAGTLNLTDDILYGNLSQGNRANSNEIYLDNAGTATVDHSDVQGGAAGAGNIDADPQFVRLPALSGSSPDYGDLHLNPKSPCAGTGVAAAGNSADHDGNLRPDLPAMGAYDLPISAANTRPTHVLWNNANGAASLWNYSAAAGTFTQNTYGPYPHWTAKTIADGGTDGLTRMLWDNTDGTASIWSLNNQTAQFTQFSFGPYPGWTATALSAGKDNTTHILWINTDGHASLWNYNAAAGTFTQNTYGPYSGWTARAVADGADGKTRLLWTNTDGTMSLWSLDNIAGLFSQFSFGPYAGWTAAALSVGTDNTTHVLWNNTNGAASVWNYSAAAGTFTQNTFGPYAGWTAKGVADGSDGKVRVLWDNTGGTASLWSLDNGAGVFSQFSFGPYAGWTASGVSGN